LNYSIKILLQLRKLIICKKKVSEVKHFSNLLKEIKRGFVSSGERIQILIKHLEFIFWNSVKGKSPVKSWIKLFFIIINELIFLLIY